MFRKAVLISFIFLLAWFANSFFGQDKPSRVGIKSSNGTVFYIPDYILESKDCHAFKEWRDSLARPGFVPINVPCPWQKKPGKVAKFSLMDINFAIPREYLYLGSRDPDGEVEMINAEFLFPTMEPARQDSSKVVGDFNITTTIKPNGSYWQCYKRDNCYDQTRGWFRIKAGLNKYGLFKKEAPKDNKKASDIWRYECKPIREACQKEFPQDDGDYITPAMRKNWEVVEKCGLEHEACRANPPKKIDDLKDFGLTVYQYYFYGDQITYLIDSEDNPKNPNYWIICKTSYPFKDWFRCESAFNLGGLHIKYRFSGHQLLKKHREIRDKLHEKILSKVSEEDRVYLSSEHFHELIPSQISRFENECKSSEAKDLQVLIATYKNKDSGLDLELQHGSLYNATVKPWVKKVSFVAPADIQFLEGKRYLFCAAIDEEKSTNSTSFFRVESAEPIRLIGQ